MTKKPNIKRPVKKDKTIDWTNITIKKEVRLELTALTRQIAADTSISFRDIRSKYRYIWCTKDHRLMPVCKMEDAHLKFSLKILFKELRSIALETKAHTVQVQNKKISAKWWYKESQLYTWSVLRQLYPVANTMIVEAKQRNLWNQLIMDMETDFPKMELELITRYMSHKFKISDQNSYIMIKPRKNDLSLSWST